MARSGTQTIPDLERRPRPWWATLPKALLNFARRKPVGAAGGVLVLAVVLVAIFAPWLATFDPLEPHPPQRLFPPGGVYLMGTDELGRDIMSRTIYGARTSVMVGMLSVLFGTTTGMMVGTISAYMGGKVDLIINTPLGRESFFDEKAIRSAAIRYNIPCITTLSAAHAVTQGIRALQQHGVSVTALQDLHAGKPITSGASAAD